jgi:dTDP-4-amino-4,6-dideoxygalactose transaminase
MLRIKNIDEAVRDAVISGIFEKKVAVNVHFVPLPMMTFYKQAGYDIVDFPVSYNNYSREISLPVYYDLTDDMADTVIEAVYETVVRTLEIQ